MLNQSQRVAVTISAVLGILTLSVCLIRSCSTIKEQDVQIDSLSITVTNKDKTIDTLLQESKAQKSRIQIQKKQLDLSESKIEFLSYQKDSLEEKLSTEKKSNQALRIEIAQIENALAIERANRAKIENLLAEAVSKNAELGEEIGKIRPLPKELKTVQGNIESIRYLLAPKMAVFLSSIDHSDAKAVFDKILPYSPKTCNDQLNAIWGPDGKNIRAICRKTGIPDCEALFFFITSSGKNPVTVSASEVKALLSQAIQSGDFVRIATTVYGCNAENVERVSTVIKQIYKLS